MLCILRIMLYTNKYYLGILMLPCGLGCACCARLLSDLSMRYDRSRWNSLTCRRDTSSGGNGRRIHVDVHCVRTSRALTTILNSRDDRSRHDIGPTPQVNVSVLLLGSVAQPLMSTSSGVQCGVDCEADLCRCRCMSADRWNDDGAGDRVVRFGVTSVAPGFEETISDGNSEQA